MIHDDMRVSAVRIFLHGFEGKDARLHAPTRAPSHEYRPSFGTSELSMATFLLVRRCSCPLRWVGIGSNMDMEEWCLQPCVSVVAPSSVSPHWKLLLGCPHGAPSSHLEAIISANSCLLACGISLTLVKYKDITLPSFMIARR
jgi:hypothetical protein